jgi:hypothetical protein
MDSHPNRANSGRLRWLMQGRDGVISRPTAPEIGQSGMRRKTDIPSDLPPLARSLVASVEEGLNVGPCIIHFSRQNHLTVHQDNANNFGPVAARQVFGPAAAFASSLRRALI